MSEEMKTITAKEFNELDRERQEAMIKDGNIAPEDAFAAFFSLHSPRLFELIDKMSLRELRRTFKNSVTYPFNKDKFKVQTEIEQRALYIANELLMNKASMQLFFEMQKAEEAQALEDANNTNGSKSSELTKGESNG